ncbi:hypothetical protein [Wolbachia endosymbiont (group B) of Gerris lacustris]
MPSKPRYFTYSSMAFFPLLSIRCLYSGNWYKRIKESFFYHKLLEGTFYE